MKNRFLIMGGIAVLLGILIGAMTGPPGGIPVASAENQTGDWPMWGGSPDRNMVSGMKGLPSSWDVKTRRNVKWAADLGSETYGNPVVSGGTVFIGTNNEGLRDPKQTGDRGVMMSFRESDGEFLWQMTHEKLSSGKANDWPQTGIASSPLVEGDRMYYVSNRCELVCLDTQGFRDNENDGPYNTEELTGPANGDVIWIFDMIKEVAAYPHNLANSSPVSFGDLIYVSTSNGRDEGHETLPSPQAPSLIAVDRKTGRLVWRDNSPGEGILHGQWAAVTVGRIGGVDQVIHPQGDGWVRGFDPLTGKKLWEFDSNPKDSVWPKTRNELISTAVVREDRVYIANGHDPEQGEGVGHLYCIDATRRGDISESGRVWHYDKIRRSMSTAAVHDGLIYCADFSGFLHCLDARTGRPHWVHDMLAAVWASPVVADGKVYLGDEDGDVAVFQAGTTKKILAENNLGNSVYSSAVPANGVILLNSRNRIFALAETEP
jgi:outer membrane protein assembly factor BamB